MQMKYIEETAQEIKLKMPWGYVTAKAYGSRAHPPVLLIHGLLDNAGSFDRLIALLPTNYYYVSIDLPGHGYSSHFPSDLPLQYFDYVYAIRLVLDGLQWNSCIAIGHSFGAQLLVSFSALYPNRIEKLILLDGIISYTIETRDFIKHIQALYNMKSYNYDPAYLYTKCDILYALKYKRHHVLNSAAAEALFKRSVTQIGDLYKYNRDPRLRQLVIPYLTLSHHEEICKKLDMPILLVIPTAGYKYNDVIGEIFASWLKDPQKLSKVVVIGNHDIHNNSPKEVAQHICEYLSNNIISKL